MPRTPPAARDGEGFDVPGDLTRRRDCSRDGVLRSLEATLARTGLDRVDVVYVHDPDDHWREAVDEAVPAPVELRDAGVVGAVGVGMNSSAMLTRFVRESDVDVVVLAGRYTLLEQSAADDLLPAAVEHGRAVVAVGAFDSGLLARADVPDDAHGTTLPAAALAFPLRHPAVVSVALGMRSAEEVARDLALRSTPVPEALWDDLAERRLLPGTRG